MPRKIVIDVPDNCFDCQFNQECHPPAPYIRWCSLFAAEVYFDKITETWVAFHKCLDSSIKNSEN
jgi:hypothetical protein